MKSRLDKTTENITKLEFISEENIQAESERSNGKYIYFKSVMHIKNMAKNIVTYNWNPREER